MAKKIKELKHGDIFFMHSIYSLKKWKTPCTFIEMENVDKYMKMRYMAYGKTGWICIEKKYKDKPASLCITVDDSEEAYREMLNAREASFFYAKNNYLRKKYSSHHVTNYRFKNII